ncbi:Hsp70 family protein, partial [Streptomyces sp. NPDC002992]|uniref:Hsp70 family protein n=1 Tax=Streptomyces sp. NPDC002992 TaxID=3154273 RepID=UPI0033B25A20
EQLVYQTEKFLKDNEEKVPGEVKTEVETAVAELKAKLKSASAEGDDTAEIRTATEKVAAVSQKLGQAMYADARAAQAAQTADGDAPQGEAKTGGGGEDEVVDAEIIDDENERKSGGS